MLPYIPYMDPMGKGKKNYISDKTISVMKLDSESQYYNYIGDKTRSVINILMAEFIT